MKTYTRYIKIPVFGIIPQAALGVVMSMWMAVTSLYAQPADLTIPIEGEYLQDYFIVNYFDHDPSGGILDGECGTKTYDGHVGTDFVLRSFAQMDSGVVVRAAAAGRVLFVIDTLFDRNKDTNAGGLGNYVCIAHDEGFFTYYAHLRTNSALVEIGEEVDAGQALGLVGSSGNSTDPHLHFEMYNKDTLIVDPFSGICGAQESQWLQQLPYDTEFGVIDHGLYNGVPFLDELRERPVTLREYDASDTSIGFWIHELGIRSGDTSRLEWRTPAGDLWFADTLAHVQDWWYYYWWSYIFMPPPEQAGEWSVRYFVNQQLVVEENFSVAGATSVDNAAPGSAQDLTIALTTNRRVVVQLHSPQAIFDAALYVEAFDMSGRKVWSSHRPSAHSSQLNFALPRSLNGFLAFRAVYKGRTYSAPLILE